MFAQEKLENTYSNDKLEISEQQKTNDQYIPY